MDRSAFDDLRESRSDWLLTFMAGVLIAIANTAFLAIDVLGVGVGTNELRLRIAHSVLACVIATWVWSRRRSPSRTFCAAAFAAMILPFFVTLWLSETTIATAGRLGVPWAPFVGHKLLMFGVAALCPRPRWLAAVLIGALCAEQIALWWFLGLGSPEARVPIDEPLGSIAYSVVAWTLYGYRLHHGRRERELAHARAEAAMLRTTNDAFLAVRDMANTPLQNLEIALALMAQQRQVVAPVLDSARRAVIRLRELGTLLPVTEVASASIDASALERVRERTQRF